MCLLLCGGEKDATIRDAFIRVMARRHTSVIYHQRFMGIFPKSCRPEGYTYPSGGLIYINWP